MAKTTDELFAEATEADYETAEPVTLAASDTEEEFQFRIDEHLRTIAIPEKGVVAGVEGDLNVNIARFIMTRYYHGRDLSKLNIRINYRNANGQVNYYTVSDATVSGDSIVFSWEFAADVTQYKGNVQFVVYLFSATNAVLKQRFFTTLGTLEVLEGLEVDSSIPVSEQTDILLHLKKDLSAYAEEVKKSLPADYTAMTEQVNSLKEDINEYILDVNEFKYTWAETYNGDYWRIPKESDQLIKDCEYIIRIMPSESFHLDVLQIGTNSAKAYMVDTIATGIEFISGKLSEFKYSPSINNLCFIRTLSASSKIASIDFYNIVKKNKLTYQVEANALNIKNIEENIGDLYSYDKIKYTEATLFNVNWWNIGGSYPQLQEGIEYIIEIEASEEFTMGNGTFQIGPIGSSDKMVDTIAEKITFKKGVTTIKYVPSQNGLCYIRFLGNGNKVISLKFYIIEKNIKDIKELKSKVENANKKVESFECLEPFAYQSSKICESLKEIRQLKNNIDETLSSVMLVKNQEGIEKRLTVHGTKSKILPISLHYESKKYSDTDRDIFFDGACNIDFSDVRFFDESGKMLNVILGKSVNLDILPDDAMDDMIKITSTGYIISFSKNTGISISKDNGKTFERLAYSQILQKKKVMPTIIGHLNQYMLTVVIIFLRMQVENYISYMQTPNILTIKKF